MVNQIRTIKHLPEGCGHVSDLSKYKSVDNKEPIHETLTKEWAVTYTMHKTPLIDETFIVHARTIEDAFDHFITLKPKTFVKYITYYGIYF